MPEHTPGPWKYQMQRIHSANGFVKYASPWLEDAWEGDKEAEANMRLMAAAPDLLAEAMSVIDQIEGIGIEDWHGAEGLDITGLRTAIAKATEG